MQLRAFIFALITISFTATICANPVYLESGGAFGKETLDSLSGTGAFKLDSTAIKNQVKISGSLIATNAEIGFLDILGDITLIKSHVKREGNILGQLKATETTFEEPLTIFSQKTVFSKSNLKKIIVKEDNAYRGKQIIELRLGTIVDGPIHFESGNGEVHLFPGSQLLDSLTGGKLVKKQ